MTPLLALLPDVAVPDWVCVVGSLLAALALIVGSMFKAEAK